VCVVDSADNHVCVCVNRFTEFYVSDMSSKEDLGIVVAAYLKPIVSNPPVENIVNFYQAARNDVETCKLADGANQKPHFSLRTLCRALSYIVDTAPRYGLHRALYDGFSMSFLTQLNRASYGAMEKLIHKHLQIKYVNTHTHTHTLSLSLSLSLCLSVSSLFGIDFID
jgi:midasin (ATPase involved in ribosome maturation)